MFKQDWEANLRWHRWNYRISDNYWFKRDVLSLTATEYDSFCTSPAYPICWGMLRRSSSSIAIQFFLWIHPPRTGRLIRVSRQFSYQSLYPGDGIPTQWNRKRWSSGRYFGWWFQIRFQNYIGETSSSPSRRHLGHYRAALSSDRICMVYATLMTLPFKFGFT